MTETEPQTQQAELPKLYPANSIYVASFMGGPLAAAIMVRKNFINLGREKEGMYALVIGILATAVIINSIILSPDALIEKLPRYLIPAIYTLIIALLVQWKLGSALTSHKKLNGPVYSNWHTFGFSMAGAVLFILLAISADLLVPGDQHIYQSKLAEFSQNEEKALKLYEMPNAPVRQILDFIDKTGIPAWKRNIELTNEADRLPDLPADELYRNILLRNYCELRVESYGLIRKSYAENTDAYDAELEAVNKKIDEVLAKLQ
jgi:hypothetical protein